MFINDSSTFSDGARYILCSLPDETPVCFKSTLHSYFEGSSNPNLKSYHELIADYTSLRVQGNYRAIGFLRQLFGNELMDMLEKTYQDMLK